MDQNEKAIRKDERKKQRRKKWSKKLLFIVLIIIIILLILIGNGYLGISPFKFYGDGDGPMKISYESDETPEEASVKTLEIIVNGSKFLYEDTAYTIEEIKVQIQDNIVDGGQVALIDRFATSLDFDALVKWLDEEDIKYNITEDYEQ
ncbi:conserved protein of unknown function [Petrocella atlantisensis]|uniref:Uncharacterized protein n=1 Tax=Petrocella atlantisensis TaxID=2173034 RepID=A0A3P7RU89_9FIRM|nr:hypothetical protein [Petrocella atlantisensis]VDN46366.1 conserved protein of unknown function [Petrocella atlantisensis]